jgi:NAD(P)-binding Rossmann-like domain
MAATTLQSEVSLPTLARLNAQRPDQISTCEVAAGWLETFSKAVASGDIDAVIVLFLEDGLWRDMLALTWTFRTIHGTSRIRKLLEARLAEAKVDKIHLSTHRDKQPSLFEAPGLVWVQAFFDFETAVGVCSGVFRVVPTANGLWKAHVMYTNMDSLRGMPYKVGPLRSFESNHGQWLDQRAKETAFEDADPKVLIVGGGHSGLDTAARLKYQDVPALVIERNPRIGDNWRDRYQALCLHGQVCTSRVFFIIEQPTVCIWQGMIICHT